VHLIYNLAAELRMVIFFPAEQSLGVAVVDRSHPRDLPEPLWERWEDFDAGFAPPTPTVCRNMEELASALAPAYDSWAAWAHRGE
jgi:hypothetical protein